MDILSYGGPALLPIYSYSWTLLNDLIKLNDS